MKIFPHILARVGGCIFSKVAALSFEKMSFVNTVLQKETDLEFQFGKVLQCFHAAFENTQDYRLRAILKNGKKDFQNQRFSFFKKLQKVNEEELWSDLIFNISVYAEWKLEYENLKREFDLIFKKEEMTQYFFLKEFFQNENMQKGILQSSHSLFLQNQKLAKKTPKDFRKKERQTLRALAQYFYRIGGKTSPFSHFTTLDILSKKNSIFQSENFTTEKRFFQYNNFLLAEMKNLLLQEPTFFRQLKVKNNPSLIYQNSVFQFIKNIKNIETIQQIDSSEILEKLYLYIIPKDGLEFEFVVDKLLEFVEADQEAIENYLLELIEIGFIEWQWGFSGLSFNWELKLEKKILSVNDFLKKEDWFNSLEKMKKYKMQMTSSESKERYFFQKSLQANFEKLGIQKIIPELIFFEDVQKNTPIQLSENEIKPIIESLNSLLQLLEPLVENEIKNQITHCWTENFKDQESVPLLIFYQKYFQISFYNNTSTNKEKKKTLNFIKSRLRENVRIERDGSFNFSIKNLENIFPKHFPQLTNSYSGLFQFYKNAGKIQAVINGLTSGYGKLFGRFLPLFEEEITIQLQKWNTEMQDEEMWIENVDASIFNANLHPPLLNNEIKNAGSQNNLSPENQISVKDLEVVWEEKLASPILVYSKTKERILIFDFGFEHPENRAPMFQLLNGFSLPHSTHRYFLQLVNELFLEEKANEIKTCRRITIDDHLILQRKFQEVPHSFFPKKEKNESNSSFFLKIQKWKSIHHFSQYVFIKPIPDFKKSNEQQSKDFFKPQLIDLNSPIAIVLLQKVLEKHKGRIRIEEMLPDSAGLIGDSVAEFVVQWKV